MDRRSVKSSNLKSIGYDGSTNVLEVEFSTGRVYQYEGVPRLIVRALWHAESIGSFFHSKIRSSYKHHEVVEEAPEKKDEAPMPPERPRPRVIQRAQARPLKS